MSLRPYFAWGCFSIFLFKAANEALIELATADVAFGRTNPMAHFWQNEPNRHCRRRLGTNPAPYPKLTK
jgi:hypothetical protein